MVVVTGGARGIGLGTAAAFARRGCRIAIADIDCDRAAEAARSLGPDAQALELDVADAKSWQLLVDEVGERLGPIDVLVNNAGIMAVGLIASESEATARRQIDINVHGVINGTKAVLPSMLTRRRGHIVNVASAAGKTAYAGGATYCAAKHAVVGFTESLRYEVGSQGIGVSLVMPGLVATELTSGLKVPRGVKAVTPGQVGDEIAAGVERNRFDIFVPRSLGPATRTLLVLPRRARDRARAFAHADDFLTVVDHDARAGYEGRAG